MKSRATSPSLVVRGPVHAKSLVLALIIALPLGIHSKSLRLGSPIASTYCRSMLWHAQVCVDRRRVFTTLGFLNRHLPLERR